MKLTGDYRFDASPQEVWDALFDPEILAAAMPGCEKLELIDGQLHGDLNVKVGPISGKFTGKVQLADQVPPVSYCMIVDGKGPHGFVKANATIELEAEGAGTRMRYDADAQVGGKIATVGQRLIETSAKAITKQSLEGLHQNIKIRAAAYRAAAEAEAAARPPQPDSVPRAWRGDSEPRPPPRSRGGGGSLPDSVPVPVPDSVPDSVPDAVSGSESVTVPVPRPHAGVPFTRSEARPPAPAPVAVKPQYQRADAAKLAGIVTKEVMRTMLPWILVVLLAIALAISLLGR